MKRVKVQRKHKWPVGSKRWSVQKVNRVGSERRQTMLKLCAYQKNFEWDVEIKEVLPRAIIGEEATLISKKHRLALVSNYFSNAFLEQRSASHSGLRGITGCGPGVLLARLTVCGRWGICCASS